MGFNYKKGKQNFNGNFRKVISGHELWGSSTLVYISQLTIMVTWDSKNKKKTLLSCYEDKHWQIKKYIKRQNE